MSAEVHHLGLPQTLDIESGHHEPWSLRTVSEKPSLPNTPSSQTLAPNSKPGSVYPSGENYEIKLEPESAPKPVSVTKPVKKEASKWILWRLWFNTYRYKNALVLSNNNWSYEFYRKFFVFTLCFNMVGLGLAASGHFPYATTYAGSIAVANLNFSVLMRNEVFGRLLYLFFNTFFAKVRCLRFAQLTRIDKNTLTQQWPPLWFRLGITSALQHLGGIHSGCALSGIAWLMFKVVNNFKKIDITHPAVLTLGLVTLVAIILSSMAAIPWVRNTHHK